MTASRAEKFPMVIARHIEEKKLTLRDIATGRARMNRVV
jgi:hypothetical protein